MTVESYPSKTITQQVACGKLHITIRFDRKTKKPNGLFVNSDSLGGCKACQNNIARLVGICLKMDMLDQVIKQLQGSLCHACNRKKATLSKEEKILMASSCGDAISKALIKSIEWEKES